MNYQYYKSYSDTVLKPTANPGHEGFINGAFSFASQLHSQSTLARNDRLRPSIEKATGAAHDRILPNKTSGCMIYFSDKRVLRPVTE